EANALDLGLLAVEMKVALTADLATQRATAQLTHWNNAVVEDLTFVAGGALDASAWQAATTGVFDIGEPLQFAAKALPEDPPAITGGVRFDVNAESTEPGVVASVGALVLQEVLF